jgi:predicted kinase
VLSPADHLRYSPGSLLVITSGSKDELDAFIDQRIDKRTVLSLDKVRALLAGRVGEEEIDARAAEVLEAAVVKRLRANETVTIAADRLDAPERERYVRMAAGAKRPRHLILVDAARDDVDERDRAALNDLRRRLDAGELGAEGFQTAVRVGGDSIAELKRIVFRHPPRDE